MPGAPFPASPWSRLETAPVTKPYDGTAARHYAAYRPPLHELILSRVLSDDDAFFTGLDVGCGTGYSSIALAASCERVFGIDPSPAMLCEATPHERVTYYSGAGERVPLPGHSVDVVTFAGSLFYADPDATGAELRRVCRDRAVVVVYDFEVLIGELLARYGIDAPDCGFDYDHRANFSGAIGLAEIAAGSERVGVQATASQLAHLLLSDPHRFDHFARRYQMSDPFLPLARELASTLDRSAVEADIYYSRYTVTTARGLTRPGSIQR